MKAVFPTGEIRKIEGRSIVLRGDDIDTDRIIPARFLKCVSFTALGDQVFADDRSELQGKHPFDLRKDNNPSILIVNNNFGCGSSREHAPQALMRWGIRGVIGQSFAEIFFGNCLALGIPCATASSKEISDLQDQAELDHERMWELNVKTEEIKTNNFTSKLKIDSGPKQMLLSGQWDATNQLISQKTKLEITSKRLPYLNNFKQNL